MARRRAATGELTGTAEAAAARRTVVIPRQRSGRVRPAVAALLSFIFPGLGQLYNGERRLAAILALPVLLWAGAVVVPTLAVRGELIARLLDTRFLLTLVVADLALLAWRVVAILQAHHRRAPVDLRSLATYPTLALAILTVTMHVVPAVYGVKAIETLNAVALGGTGGGGIREVFEPEPSRSPVPGETEAPEPQPVRALPALDRGERINVLLVGIDEAPGRQTILTDTMLVVSLDPDTGRTAMISIPRDMFGVPLRGGGRYDAKLNSLMAVAGMDALKGAIGELLGAPIHYFAAINLLGFEQAVDAIGGVDIYVERPVNDPTYDRHGFYIDVGWHHMDGATALAFVRSRHGYGDNDFTRSVRQQQLLTAVREKLTAVNLLASLPALLNAVQSMVATDVPADQIPIVARAVQEADPSALRQAVLQPPEYSTPATGPGGTYILLPNLPAIRALGQELLAD